MATSMNIGGQDDEFNRYKMPSVIAKVEGRGNGIKTRIVNCAEVARALHRPAGYVCKFFGCELGAQTKIDDNDGTYIVNGSFTQAVLQDVLKKFINMFVLCTACNLPETDLKVRKNGVITQACNACGAEAPCDMTHKLCTYIFNYPPGGKKKKGESKKDKAARREAKSKKKGKHQSDEDIGTNGNGNGNGNTNGVHSTVEVGHQNGSALVEDHETIGLIGDFSMNDEITVDSGVIENDEDVEWSVDTSKEAEEARKRELGAAASILERGATTTNGVGEEGGEESVDSVMDEEKEKCMKLQTYIDDGKKAWKVLNKSEKIFGEDDAIRGLMMSAIYSESLANIPQRIEERVVPVFQFLGKPMNKEAQKELLHFLDWVGQVDEGKYVSVLPHMLKTLYDSDVMEESVIMKWFDESEGPESVRKSVQVIIDWLKEEDDDEEEEESD